MEKSRVLILGCGGCGNQLLSKLLDLDSRYTGIFLNTNLSEMTNLKHFDRKRKCFYVANADGTGKKRDLAEEYLKEEAPKFSEMILKFENQDYITFLGSLDGGTGSKSMTLLPKLIKKLCPEKSINIVATFPKIDESDIAFENTIDTWNEINELKKRKIIDSIQFIDNNKGVSEEDINIKSMKELDNGFNVIGGKLDSSDSDRVHRSNGYKVILKLDKIIKNTKEAIDKAISDSMFYVPDNFECDIAIGNINTNIFDMKVIKNEFEAYGFTKLIENQEGESIIVLGGCDMPKEAIELTKEALKETKNKKRRRVIEDDEIVRRGHSEEEITEAKEKEAKSKLSSKDLNDMFADDSFWND